jgi:heptose I phosphotransferase
MRLKQSWLARWRIKDLAQLLFSSDLPGITRTDRLRFFKKYLGIRRLDADARWLLRRIQWKASLYHRHNATLARKAAA